CLVRNSAEAADRVEAAGQAAEAVLAGGRAPAGHGARQGGGRAAGMVEWFGIFPNPRERSIPWPETKSGGTKVLGARIYQTPVAGEGAVIAMSSGMGTGNAIALKPGGSGEITESQRLWRLDRVKSGMGSGVIHEGHFYTISSDGIALCLDLSTGKTVWEERL